MPQPNVSIVFHVNPFMATIYPSFNGYFTQLSNWFHEDDNEFSVLQWPHRSPDLNPIQHLWDVAEQEIHSMNLQLRNLLKLCDAIMATWTRISKVCFQHLVESMSQKNEAVLRAKGVSIQY